MILKTKAALLPTIALFMLLVSCSDIFLDSLDSAVEPIPRYDSWWQSRHNEKVSNAAKKQKLILIGNSITQGWENAKAMDELNIKYGNRITNLGFNGDETQNVIWRLQNGELSVEMEPEYVSLMIGTNNRQSSNEIAKGIEKILDIIMLNAPDAKILLFSILPRGIGIKDSNTKRNYEVNALVEKFDGSFNIRYFDISQYYVNGNGYLKAELFTDNLHLSEHGYVIWKDKLIEIIESDITLNQGV